jgi:hypothetical protein
MPVKREEREMRNRRERHRRERERVSECCECCCWGKKVETTNEAAEQLQRTEVPSSSSFSLHTLLPSIPSPS